MDNGFRVLFTIFIVHFQNVCFGEEAGGQNLGPKDIPIVVLSQGNLFHARRAAIFKKHLLQQNDPSSNVIIKDSDIHLLHEWWSHMPGAWTVLPIIPQLAKDWEDKTAVLFCEEETRINLSKLYESLKQYDFTEHLFLGRGLRDQEATIIHHFAFHESPSSFVYPDFSAGFVLSLPLIKSLASRLEKTPQKTGFAIDPKHELAMYIWNDGEGERMKEVDFLCFYQKEQCATHFPTVFPDCGKAVSEDDVFFAVKTCEKFHTERVPVVKDTWGPNVKHMEYYSDKEDISIPTVDLGVPNTERGHCGKTMAILRRFRTNHDFADKKWLVIADDDSLINVKRLYELLACYDAEEPVALGERYGYGVNEELGYNYITGGGGMVFSRPAVKMLVDLEMCSCGTDDAPDDMVLGMCMKRLGIYITHSPYFHQARPMDYARGFLEHQEPVSFHKHWNVDPRKVFRDWLSPDTKDEL